MSVSAVSPQPVVQTPETATKPATSAATTAEQADGAGPNQDGGSQTAAQATLSSATQPPDLSRYGPGIGVTVDKSA
jgi:hypothetical protein